MTDLGGLLSALADAGVKFIVVGGAAATAHGAARLTQDIDVVYARDPENLERLATARSYQDEDEERRRRRASARALAAEARRLRGQRDVATR